MKKKLVTAMIRSIFVRPTKVGRIMVWRVSVRPSALQYHFKSLHIISRHYKKSLLRSQIYHGYEELSTDTNYPIWRRQKLPYMKKTRKKKQVCGAACFMAAEIKFSEDVRKHPCHNWLFNSLTSCVGSCYQTETANQWVCGTGSWWVALTLRYS